MVQKTYEERYNCACDVSSLIITKSNIIKAMISKAESVSSDSYRPEARDKAINIARTNGYYDIPHPRYRSRYIKDLPILKITFISDNFTRNLDITLKYLDIIAQIIITTPLTLRKLFIKLRIYDNKCTRISCDICDKKNSKMDGICQIKGCAYRIDCTECGQFYIGETMQPLYMRYNQHKGDIRHPDRQKPWSEHVKINHNGRVVRVIISVLLREQRLTLRKIYEALFIKELNPEINIKQEMNDALKFLCI